MFENTIEKKQTNLKNMNLNKYKRRRVVLRDEHLRNKILIGLKTDRDHHGSAAQLITRPTTNQQIADLTAARLYYF